MFAIVDRGAASREEVAGAKSAQLPCLLNQQAWCWGYDVRRPEGNLLLDFGLQRQRPDGPCRGSSRYMMQWSNQSRVLLWGHGVFCGAASVGGLYLPRFNAVPMRTGWADLPPICWTAEELHDLHVVRQPAERQAATYLLRCLLRWIARYETWVIAKHGLAYRRRSLAGWHRPQVLPEEMPGRWLRLAAQAARCFPGRLDAETRKNACRQAQHSV